MPQTIKASDGTELDAGVVNLSRAIRARESKGDYNAVGDAGTSKGAYQWQPGNFESAAKQYGLDPKDFSPVNQDKVAYQQVKALKDKGYTPEQVAAAWNAGEGSLQNDKWKTNVGDTTINGQTVHYDTPSYVNSVVSEFQKLKGSNGNSGYNPTPFSNPTGSANPGQINFSGIQAPTPQPQSNPTSFLGQAGQEFSQAGSDIGTSASKLGTGVSELTQGNVKQGAQDTFNGALQTVGAGAGLIGQLTNTALEHTPIVGTALKGIENLIGAGVGSLAKTEAGQAVAKSVGEFSAAHPEISKDIGAGFNIVTAIPILKGLSVVKNVAMDATASALKNYAEKAATKDITEVMQKTARGSKYLERNPDVVKTLIDERAIPDIEGGRFTVSDAKSKLGQQISTIEDTKLTPLLESGNSPAIKSRMPFEDILKNAETFATNAQEDFAPIKKELDLVRKKFGDYPTIAQLNEAKRTVSRKISEGAFNNPDSSAMKVARSVLQDSVEKGARALGLGDVAAINQEMARLIKAQDALDFIVRKAVPLGKFGKTMVNAATVGGEVLGEMHGVPAVGGFAARYGAKRLASGAEGFKNELLKRTGQGAQRTTPGKAVKGLGGGLIGSLLQHKASSGATTPQR